MSSALLLKLDRLAYYQRLVLQAQTEVADTYYLDGKFNDAIDYFKRLLKLENPDLDRELILYKLTRSCAGAAAHGETLVNAQLFGELHPESEHLAEVRFLQAEALKHLGRKQEAVQVVLSLVTKQRAKADKNQENWAYWQQRTGNELANQLYQEGDFLNSLEIYRRLGEISGSTQWRLPAWYQAGLIYERLKQPEKADEFYGKILDTGKDLDAAGRTPSLDTILDMTRWRKERLGWQAKAEASNQTLTPGSQGPPTSEQ
jgi:tetratricopeptide (TPR) repeat protein